MCIASRKRSCRARSTKTLATISDWEKQTNTQTAGRTRAQGECVLPIDQFQQAIDTMKQAIAKSDKPNDSWSQILMGSYFELNQYDEA